MDYKQVYADRNLEKEIYFMEVMAFISLSRGEWTTEGNKRPTAGETEPSIFDSPGRRDFHSEL